MYRGLSTDRVLGLLSVSLLLSFPAVMAADKSQTQGANSPACCRLETQMPDISHLCLWLQLNWSEHGLSSECKPVLDGKGPTLSKEQLQQFWTKTNEDPKVNDLVNGWRGWYDRILKVVRTGAGNKTPDNDIRFKISATVNDDHTIQVFTDFADGMDSKKAEQYARRIKNALSKLDKKPALAFPSGSKLKQTKFEIQTGGFNNLELVSIGQPLGL